MYTHLNEYFKFFFPLLMNQDNIEVCEDHNRTMDFKDHDLILMKTNFRVLAIHMHI